MTNTAVESPAPEQPCQFCGAPFISKARNGSGLYCSTKCKDDMGNFMAKVGKRIAADALLWRRTRGAAGVGAAAFKRLCALLDEGNEEFRQRDAAEGVKRPPTIDSYVAAVNAGKGIRRGLDRH
tara:strand:+ start:7035 stop:7406 length:372 start_codon:yes stop_codon:yes gene_type:complete